MHICFTEHTIGLYVGLETHTRECFLCMLNFQPSKIAHCLKSGLETIHEPPLYLIWCKSCNRLAHTLWARELEQYMLLPRVFQNTLIYIQGNVTQECILVCAQRNISNWVLQEESSKRDEELFLSRGEIGGDLDNHMGWIQVEISNYVVPQLLKLGLLCHLIERTKSCLYIV